MATFVERKKSMAETQPLPNILVADDHAIIRTGIKYLLKMHFNLQVTQETDSCSDLMDQLKSQPFTHVILDMQLGDCNVIDILGKIRTQYPQLIILIYSMAPVEIFGKRLINMGVSGFLSKQENETEVVKALQLILQRRQYLSPALQQLLNQKKQPANNQNNPFDDLSEREISVVNYLLKGYRVKEISNMLDIKLSTVATYKARIFEKLGVTNKMDMKRLAEIYHFGDDLM